MSHLEPELLSAYVDAEIDSAERALVDRHVAECRACADQLEALGFAAASVRALDAPVMPELHRKQLWREINRTRRAPATRWRAMVTVAGTAAAIAAFAGLTMVGTSSGPNVLARDVLVEADGGEWSDANLDDAMAIAEQTVMAAPQEVQPAEGTDLGARSGGVSEDSIQDDFNHGARIAQCEESIKPGGDGGAIAIRYVVATFEGVPAYVLVYDTPRESPATREVFAVARADCAVLAHRTAPR